jgi:formylglycine-generating enzyme required for sulfatase activity
MYQTEAEKDGQGGHGYAAKSNGNYEWKQDPKYSWRDPGFEQGDSHPVVNVSWNDAVAYCNWLSKKEDLPEYYRIGANTVSIQGGRGYRLPTEAEWEYACRAGTTTAYCHGNNDEGLAQVGNIADSTVKKKFNWEAGPISASDGFATTAPVGNFRANGFGLYDMHGNVWEWCWDGYAADFYDKSPSVDPRGFDSGSRRVDRGGSWRALPRGCRSAARYGGDPSFRDLDLGFRVASSPFGPEK